MKNDLQLAGCLIRHPAKPAYLLLHRQFKTVTQWELPGGKIETNETPWQAAKRELSEELGVELVDGELIMKTTFVENGQTIIYFVFKADTYLGQPRLMEPDKFDKFDYLTTNEIMGMEKDLSANMQLILETLKQLI